MWWLFFIIAHHFDWWMEVPLLKRAPLYTCTAAIDCIADCHHFTISPLTHLILAARNSINCAQNFFAIRIAFSYVFISLLCTVNSNRLFFSFLSFSVFSFNANFLFFMPDFRFIIPEWYNQYNQRGFVMYRQLLLSPLCLKDIFSAEIHSKW